MPPIIITHHFNFGHWIANRSDSWDSWKKWWDDGSIIFFKKKSLLYAASTAPAVQQIIVVVARGLKIAGFFYKKKHRQAIQFVASVLRVGSMSMHACRSNTLWRANEQCWPSLISLHARHNYNTSDVVDGTWKTVMEYHSIATHKWPSSHLLFCFIQSTGRYWPFSSVAKFKGYGRRMTQEPRKPWWWPLLGMPSWWLLPSVTYYNSITRWLLFRIH